MSAAGADVQDECVADVAPGSAFTVDSSVDVEEYTFPALARCDEVHVDGQNGEYLRRSFLLSLNQLNPLGNTQPEQGTKGRRRRRC
jgi:hypothetical protein